MNTVIEKLIQRGLNVHYEDEWVGAPPNRHAVKTTEIRAITLPLTDEEWCDLCMRDSEGYLGGCCAQTAYIQDAINDVFRDSGTMDARAVFHFVDVSVSHDGFELLSAATEAQLLEQEKDWDDLDTLARIVLCVAAVKPMMRSSWSDGPGRTTLDPADPKNVVSVLRDTFGYLSHKDLVDEFYSDDAAVKPTDHAGNRKPTARELNPKKNGQDHGNVALRVARAVPAARYFLDLAHKVVGEPFRGFAIVDDKGQIAANGFGSALYHTNDDAVAMLVRWKKSNDVANEQARNPAIDTYVIRGATVSIEHGLVLE